MTKKKKQQIIGFVFILFGLLSIVAIIGLSIFVPDTSYTKEFKEMPGYIVTFPYEGAERYGSYKSIIDNHPELPFLYSLGGGTLGIDLTLAESKQEGIDIVVQWLHQWKGSPEGEASFERVPTVIQRLSAIASMAVICIGVFLYKKAKTIKEDNTEFGTNYGFASFGLGALGILSLLFNPLITIILGTMACIFGIAEKTGDSYGKIGKSLGFVAIISGVIILLIELSIYLYIGSLLP